MNLKTARKAWNYSRVKGGWKWNQGGQVFPSFIQAHQASYAGNMTLEDITLHMLDREEPGDVTLRDCAAESMAGTLEVVRSAWMGTYKILSESRFQLRKGFLRACQFKDRVNSQIEFAEKIQKSLEIRRNCPLWACFEEAKSQFALLLKAY